MASPNNLLFKVEFLQPFGCHVEEGRDCNGDWGLTVQPKTVQTSWEGTAAKAGEEWKIHRLNPTDASHVQCTFCTRPKAR